MEPEATPDAEVRADLKLLLECLKCQQDNPTACKQALLTISSICTSNSKTKEYFHECGGLQYILNLILSTSFGQIKESALYCLGCCVERNVFLQKKVSTNDVFSNLYNLLTSPTSTKRLRQTVSFLVLCIVANNSYGQVLTMRSGCLQAMIQIFRSCLESDQTSGMIQEPIDQSALQLWSSVASALSMCVNNPQNDDNQRLCATLLPYTFKLLQECQLEAVIRPVGAFLGLLVANNVYNQDRVRKCGGLEVILAVIQRLHNLSRRDPHQLSLALHMVNTLDSCVADNGASATAAGEHEAVQTLLSLLSETQLDGAAQLQVILTLGHITDLSEPNQKVFIEVGGLPLLLYLMGECGDEEISKAIKYVLQSCGRAMKSEPVDLDETVGLKRREPHNLHFDETVLEQPSQRRQQLDSIILEKITLLTEKLDSMDKSGAERDRQHKQHETAKEQFGQASFQEMLASLNQGLDPKSGTDKNVLRFEKLANIQNLLQSSKKGNKVISERKQPKGGQLFTEIFQEGSPSSDGSTVNLTVNAQDHSQTAEKSKKDVRRLHEPCKVGNSLCQEQKEEDKIEKQLLLEQLEQEKKKRESLEQEAAGLREAVDRQRQRDEETKALREELERQEREATVSSSSQGSNEVTDGPGVSHHCNNQPVNSSDWKINQSTNNSGVESKGENFEKPGLPMPSRRRTPASTSLSHKATSACSSSAEQREIVTTRRVSNSSCAKVPKERHSRTFSQPCLTANTPDLNQSFASDIQSEFDFKLLARAHSTGQLDVHQSGHCRTTPRWSVSGQQRPLLTSTPVYGTLQQCRRDGGLQLSHVYSVKPVRRGPSQISARPHPRYTAGSEGRFIQPEDFSDDDDALSCRSVMSVAHLPSKGLCPGCHPPRTCGLPLLNSRTYNIVLETNPHTCALHRQIRKLERQLIRQRHQERCTQQKLQRKSRPLEALNGRRNPCLGKYANGKATPSVYDFMKNRDDSPKQDVTPGCHSDTTCPTADVHAKNGEKFRKPRVPYTNEETENLLRGVRTLGKHWQQILCTYQFHPFRTAVDLMEKHKRLVAEERKCRSHENSRPIETPAGPFSLCEERRLKRGVKRFGYNWKLILQEFRFARGRTKEELRNKWRTMHKSKLTHWA